MSQQTVTINGVLYDAQTGLPLQSAAQIRTPHFPAANTHHSQNVHATTQKSATLNRAFVKKATPTVVQKQFQKPAIQKSPSITKFAPHPHSAQTKSQQKRSMDIGPVSHPMAARVHQKVVQSQPAKPHTVAVAAHAPKPSQIIKQEAIADAMKNAPTHTAKSTKPIKHPKKHSRTLSIMSASLALLMLAGYFTYLNMPNLSVRVAAAQAGFDATYPGYHPDGYSINGPVAYNEGWVSMKFAANGGDKSFTVKQEKSGWDSSALLANYVEPTSKGGYVPHSEQGLTVYIFNNSAAWVNGGVRYTIEGDAPLSSSQILNIAKSM